MLNKYENKKDDELEPEDAYEMDVTLAKMISKYLRFFNEMNVARAIPFSCDYL